MAAYDYDLGILGGGAAGLTAAAGSAQFGAKTILVEKAKKLGGDCLHFGCVPSKTLIRSAAIWSLARRAKEFGLPEIELPPVSLAAVMERVRSVIDTIQEHDSPERFCKLGAEVRFGNPRFMDDHAVSVDGDRLTARAWIIATGSSPALPPVEGLADVPYWTNETVFSRKELPGHLVVLGGGPIGVEMAQSFRRLGSQVTIVEYADQVLGPEDPDIAAILRNRLEAEGVKVLTDTKAVKAVAVNSSILLRVAPAKGEGEPRTIEGDVLLVAAGRKPNVEGLELSAAGVAFSPRGVPADARMRTNVSHIYACGDVNGVFPFTHVAGYEAGIALSNAVLRFPRKADYTKVPWCTYTDPEVASIGLNEKRAKAAGVEYRVLESPFRSVDRALAEGETAGKIKVLISPSGALLGCQIAGHHAGELIHEWVAAINGGVKLSTLAGAIHAYPTLAEISKKAAGSYFSEKLFSDRTKKILRFLFDLKGRACTPEEEAAG
ncbi:MAG TPA: mercuric reductase [Deltaproteobacteria bacterium]|nr:MAG: mercuric reductase [Deltaproteobacteria bacterium GWA2_65_63]OGP28046.1 MAG: mercuric reductase [Deltaproteobacteria bacterium GWB2_65_81]OGP36771.1 MAG: mercuric reductase [Deltaproteobacteria bacterium GWC2_66_88]HBG73245.1 mercuric reductase [Deltaproteobacteria bacterium]